MTSTDPISLRPEDIVEPLPPDHDGDPGRARKRRRIEAIANQYIKLGRAPLIVSAGLRGPFDNGWTNPWAKPLSAAVNEPTKPGKETDSHGTKAARAAHTRAAHTRARNPPPISSVPSPETLRGLDVAHDSFLPPDDAEYKVHISSASPTISLDDAGATEPLGIDLEPSVTFDNFESNPFWLKRPLPKSTAPRNSLGGNHDPSPTRARLGSRPVDQQGRLKLVTPRQPIKAALSDLGRNEQEPDWMSTASASMILTSLATPAQIIQEPACSSTSAKRKRTYSKFERSNPTAGTVSTNTPRTAATLLQVNGEFRSSPGKHVASASEICDPQCSSAFTPFNAIPPNAEAMRDPKVVPSEKEARTGSTNNSQKSKQNIHTCIELCEPAAPSMSPTKVREDDKKIIVNDATPAIRHNHVTSPTYASSSGFIYRKIGESKRRKPSEKPKSRPQTLSSPAKMEQHPTERIRQEEDLVHEAYEQETIGASEPRTERVDIYDIPRSPPEQQSHRSSRTSGFSTQAALLMAQMEFQNGTMDSATENDTTPWLHAVDSTPHEDPIIPSPAFTPFHKFNATLEAECPPEPTMHDIPISTQDLFATISPFGYSTIKRSARPPASNMRLSVFASQEQDTPSYVGHKSRPRSPTPSQRIPLKAKNMAVSFVGSRSEKGSQGERGSQESMTPQTSKTLSMQTVDVTLLDLHTSLDDLRRNDDLSFTDRFLLNFTEMT